MDLEQEWEKLRKELNDEDMADVEAIFYCGILTGLVHQTESAMAVIEKLEAKLDREDK